MVYGLVANAEARPGHPALVCAGRCVTYGELDRLVNRVAHALRDRGLMAGGRVAVMLPNSIEFFTVTQAAAKLGALVVPVNTRFRRDEIAYLLADAGVDAFVFDAAYIADAVPALAAARRPAAARCLVLGRADGFTNLADAVAGAPDVPPPAELRETGYNLMIYTSGTTGRPKGVVRQGFDARTSFEAHKRLVAMWGFTPDDVHLMVGPAYHTLPSAYVLQHLFVGATSVLMPKFDAEESLRLIDAERVTTSGMVPAHFIRILELPPDVRARYDLSSLKKVMHAAAPCPVPVKRRIMEVFPRDSVWEFYGATEGPGTIISPQEWLAHPGSVGRPWPGVAVRVVGDDGRPVPAGEIGTIYLSSPAGGFEYHNAPDKTAAAFRDGFFTVGDMGYLDTDGYLFIADRRADMVISGGVNVYPAEIESVLAAHPDVIDAAVFGVPDARWGESLHAVVEPRKGSALAGDDLRSWCRERLADFKCPRAFDLVAELPRDPNGKVLKRQLREPFWAGREKRV
jgi:long-chain acyl-CoA synthetase